MERLKILIIGGTGTISSAITRQLAENGHELWLLNRGTRKQEVPGSVKHVIADIDDTEAVLAGLGDAQFDAVCEFIGRRAVRCRLRVHRLRAGAGGTRHQAVPRTHAAVRLHLVGLGVRKACT